MNRPFVFIMALVSAGLIGWMMIAILPVLIIICMISIIGIPLGIALMALPTIYAYMVVAGAICWLLTPSWRSFLVGMGVALGIGIFVPAVINYNTNALIKDLSNSQFIPEVKPASLPAIWLLEEEKSDRISDRVAQCSRLCLYLLYEKAAPMVGSRLIIDGKAQDIRYYTVDKRTSCEQPRFMNSAFDSSELVDMEKINTRIKAGECLVASNARPSSYILASISSSENRPETAGPLHYARLVLNTIEAEKQTLLLNRVFYSGGMLAQPMYLNLEGGSQLKTWFELAHNYFVSDANGQPGATENRYSIAHGKLSPVNALRQYGFIE